MDILEQLAQLVANATQNYQQANLNSLDITRENEYANINNNYNARGLLYSTAVNDAQNAYNASKYIPNYSKIRTASEQNLLTLRKSMASVNEQISSLEGAASTLMQS